MRRVVDERLGHRLMVADVDGRPCLFCAVCGAWCTSKPMDLFLPCGPRRGLIMASPFAISSLSLGVEVTSTITEAECKRFSFLPFFKGGLSRGLNLFHALMSSSSSSLDISAVSANADLGPSKSKGSPPTNVNRFE